MAEKQLPMAYVTVEDFGEYAKTIADMYLDVPGHAAPGHPVQIITGRGPAVFTIVSEDDPRRQSIGGDGDPGEIPY
jgi:hypothetical protein